MWRSSCALLFLVLLLAPAVVDSLRPRVVASRRLGLQRLQQTKTPQDSEKKPKASGKPEVSQEKMAAFQEEITSPFRGLRFFLYGAGFLGGGLGGLTALSQLIGGLGGGANAPPVSQSLQNVAIDLAVVAVAVLGWRADSTQQEAKREALKTAGERRSGAVTDSDAAEKLRMLCELQVLLSVDEQDAPKGAVGLKAKLDDMLGQANQGVVVFATTSAERMKEVLVKAQILGEPEFSSKNVLVVPVEMEKLRQAVRGGRSTENKGFGSTSQIWLEQSYVAPPAPGAEKAWLEYIEKELADAEAQGAKEAAKEGFAICVRKNKTVARRGLGVPIWEDVLSELNASA
uniref:Uncharacterized protein n=1 Tax=Pinguiococcus pyrenoidosus TaxID=172671 RepID=A0A7R9YFC6_9STRA|mmetsp:Transcript_6411/g.24885  ORF Transcript_6411/g.24885 Transcript_6411/m.24885 type:complete len:344 (+) Transcript_6411:111-1142(+)